MFASCGAALFGFCMMGSPQSSGRHVRASKAYASRSRSERLLQISPALDSGFRRRPPPCAFVLARGGRKPRAAELVAFAGDVREEQFLAAHERRFDQAHDAHFAMIASVADHVRVAPFAALSGIHFT